MTMRSSISCAASRAAAASSVEIRNEGTLRSTHQVRAAREGPLVACRDGRDRRVDAFGRERERYKIPMAPVINSKEGER